MDAVLRGLWVGAPSGMVRYGRAGYTSHRLHGQRFSLAQENQRCAKSTLCAVPRRLGAIMGGAPTGMVRCGMAGYGYSMVWQGMVWYVVQYFLVRYGMAGLGIVWYVVRYFSGMWYGIILYGTVWSGI